MNNPDDGLLSHCNRAKILIKLCILTVIAEHFCVFECMRVFIPVCMRGCVCTDVSFFPLVQCTYIGPTVHMHNFLPSLKLRARSFLHTHSDYSFLKDWPGTSSVSPLLLTGNHTHLSNLLITWNDQPVIIIDQTHLYIDLLLTPTTALNKMLHPSGSLPLERTVKD